VFLDEGFLKSFIESTEALTPDEKATKLETDEVINKNVMLLQNLTAKASSNMF
jgi:hypothetical protein